MSPVATIATTPGGILSVTCFFDVFFACVVRADALVAPVETETASREATAGLGAPWTSSEKTKANAQTTAPARTMSAMPRTGGP
jgi:hypothetical protein